MNKVKVGILGAGHIAAVHAALLKQDERVEIVGIADIFEEKAKELAAEAGPDVHTAGSIEELIALGVDTVYVTTPNTMHVSPVLHCLKNNVNVFSEKPMATSEEEARQIRDAARESEGCYNLGMNRRYAYVYKKIKSYMDSGQLDAYSAHFKMNRGELLHPAWTSDPTKTGGFLYETPFHLMDLCRYYFGEVKKVKCEATQAVSGSELDNFAILLTFESGLVMTFNTFAHSGWSFPFEAIEIYGKYSTASTAELETVKIACGLEGEIDSSDYHLMPVSKKWGYEEEDRLFIDALVNGTEPPVNAEEAYKSTFLLTSIYESAKTGKEINISDELNKVLS